MKLQTTKIFAEIVNAKKAGYQVVSEQGSSRSSKTYNTVIWLIWYAMTTPNTTITVCRKTLPSLKGSVLRDFQEILDKIGQWEKKCFNKSELIYTFANGSWVEFISCDSEQKLRGRKRKILYVNEANELDFLEWQQLQMRTTEFTVIDYNPSFTDDHWICSVNQDQRTYHFITTYKDNPFLEQRVIDEIESLREKNKSLWQIYGLGLQAVIEGLVFDTFTEIDEIPSYAKKHRFLCIDYGYTNDPTAICEVCICDDTIYIDEVSYATHMLTGDIIAALKGRIHESKYDYKVISESADPRMVDEIYNAGIDIHPVHKYGGSVLAGIQKMQEMRIVITKRSQNVKRELKNYVYRQDKNGNWLNEPIDAYNHAIDAVRYVILEEVLGTNDNSLTTEEIACIL